MPDLCCYYTSIYTSIDLFIYYYINILLNYNIRTLSWQQLAPLRRGPLYTLHPFSYGPGERVLRSFRLTGQRFVLLSALLVHPPLSITFILSPRVVVVGGLLIYCF